MRLKVTDFKDQVLKYANKNVKQLCVKLKLTYSSGVLSIPFSLFGTDPNAPSRCPATYMMER